jgi:hypothetical protein
MSLEPFFKWCDATWVSTVIRDSRYIFPVIETFHLFALTLLLGTVCVINLRLFGLIMRRQPVSQLARDLAPWTLGGLIVVLTSGILLFLSEAMKCYGSVPFQYKMVFLFSAIIFHYTIFRYVTKPDEVKPVLGAFTAIVSLTLWFGVGVAGRAIGFF